MTGQIRRPPPADGLREVLQVGRRRRRRASTGMTIVAAIALVGGVAAWARMDGGRSGLDFVRDFGLVVTSSPAPGRTPASPAPSRQSPHAAVPSTAEVGDRASTMRPDRPGSERPASRNTETSGDPIMRGPRSSPGPVGCGNDARSLSRYCTAVSGPETVKAGTPAEFVFSVCVWKTSVPEKVTFATRQEAEFTVTEPGEPDAVQWRWSRGFRFPPLRHEMQVEGGRCYSWAIDWAGTGTDGRPLPEGAYTMTAQSWAIEWQQPQQGLTPTPAHLTVEVVH